MASYKKDYAQWHSLKMRLDAEHHEPTFSEREIWWCSVGVNVGFEVDGKNQNFDRPVLVLRKFNKRLFWGIPLSSRLKESPHYFRFTYNQKEQSALLTHLRTYDSKRMTNKMGKLSNQPFQAIQKAVANRVLKT